ncbi:MAG: hypothetical protein J5702_03425 [Bacteroidales bacterium]|nr:hypothetical protein [Bacteroidales bacterium]
MELYRISRYDLTHCGEAVRKVAAETGRSVAYHRWDFLTSVVRYGVGPRQYAAGGFYALPAFVRKDTYTRRRRDRLCKALNDKAYQHLLKNKEEFNAAFAPYIGRAWMHCGGASAEAIADFIARNRRVIVKPCDSEKGHGIYFLDAGTPAATEAATKLAGTDTLLEERLTQHPQMCFGNQSVNTLRINTVVDRDGAVHVVSSALRCGVGEAPVDNFSGGGVVYPLSNTMGRITGPGKSLQSGGCLYVHPQTDFFMPGRAIPFWNEALDLVKAAAKVVPQIRLVGWDVAILESGPVLIEGNTKPGETLMECRGEGEKGVYRTILSLV